MKGKYYSTIYFKSAHHLHHVHFNSVIFWHWSGSVSRQNFKIERETENTVEIWASICGMQNILAPHAQDITKPWTLLKERKESVCFALLSILQMARWPFISIKFMQFKSIMLFLLIIVQERVRVRLWYYTT